MRAEESAVLFREESIAVRLFKAFIHQQAAHYIDYCIGNLITTVNALEKPLEVRLARQPTFWPCPVSDSYDSHRTHRTRRTHCTHRTHRTRTKKKIDPRNASTAEVAKNAKQLLVIAQE